MDYFIVTTTYLTYKQFLTPITSELIKRGDSVTVMCNLKDKKHSDKSNIAFVHIDFSRSIFSFNNYISIFRLRSYFKDKKGIINVHTPIASTITRLAVLGLPIPIIYTAHGFHFHRDSSWLSWRVYYSIERLLSKYTKKIITINHQDYSVVMERFKTESVVYLPGIGYKPNLITIEEDNFLQKELNIPPNRMILLSVGELNKNKNHRLVIDYMKMNEVHDEFHYVICGLGPLESKLRRLCKIYNLEKRVHFLGYRNDVLQIINYSHLFVFPSLREGLPVSLMEAIHQEKDIIAYKIRGNEDLIPDQFHDLFLIEPYKESQFYVMLTDKIIKWKMNQSITTRSEWVDKNKLDVILPEYIEAITQL